MSHQTGSRKRRGSSLLKMLAGRQHEPPRFRRLCIEPLEDRRVLSVDLAPELPGMYLVDPDVDKLRGQVVYLDSDGEQNVTYHGPVTIGPFDVPPFVAPGELAGQEDAIMAEVTDQLNELFASVDVTFTLDRPNLPGTYSTVYVGGDGAWARQYGDDFLGLAETVDLGNQNPADNAFVFTEAIAKRWNCSILYSSLVTELVSHEAAHLFGYVHSDSELSVPFSISDHAGTVKRIDSSHSIDTSITRFGFWDRVWPYNNQHWRAYSWHSPSDLKNQAIIAQAFFSVSNGDNPSNHELQVRVHFHRQSYATWNSTLSAAQKYDWAAQEGSLIAGWTTDGSDFMRSISSSVFSEEIWKAANWNQEIAFSWFLGTLPGASPWNDTFLFDADTSFSLSTYGPPELNNVPDGIAGHDARLDWQDLALPSQLKYQLQLSRHANFASPLIDVKITNHSYLVSGSILDDGGTYYWRVRTVYDGSSYNASDWNSGSFFIPPDIDTDPPTPNPSTWATEPYPTGGTSIRMVATTASDPSGVEYYFQETSGNPGGSDSGWQDSRAYEDKGLTVGRTYTYRVRTRDKSPNQNEGSWSVYRSATTPDTTPPTPNPSTWATEPYATSSSSVRMVATTANDPSGVEYYFQEISGNPGGSDSGWQDSPVYEDAGLTRDRTYTYRVKTRDKSLNRNEGNWSEPGSASTGYVVATRGNLPAKSPMASNLVVVTHGWYYPEYTPTDLDDWWLTDMGSEIAHFLHLTDQGHQWDVWVYDWRDDSTAPVPSFAADNAYRVHGLGLGDRLADFYYRYDHVHLIGHSAGSWLIDQAANILANAWSQTTIHTTYLDAYYAVKNPLYWNPGKSADWAEQYYTSDLITCLIMPSCAGVPSNKAFNVEVSALRETPGSDSSGFMDGFIDKHSWPHEWYLGSIREAVNMVKDEFFEFFYQLNSIYQGLGFFASVEFRSALGYPPHSGEPLLGHDDTIPLHCKIDKGKTIRLSQVLDGDFWCGTLDIWDTDGDATIIEREEDLRYRLSMITASPVTVGQKVDVPDEPFRLEFEYEFLTTTGTLQVTLDSITVAEFEAPASLNGSPGVHAVISDDLGLMGAQGVPLQFMVDGPTGSQLLLGGISLTPADLAPPSAELAAFAEQTSQWQEFTIRYTDNEAVDVSSVIDNDAAVLVVGPRGFIEYAHFMAIDEPVNGSDREVTYRVLAPDGLWTDRHRGRYRLLLVEGQVVDTSGLSADAAVLGEFQVGEEFDPSVALSTYLGGSQMDVYIRTIWDSFPHDGVGVTVDSAGNVFVASTTYSEDFDGAINEHHGESLESDEVWGDAYVAKLSPMGETLWVRYLGGGFEDRAMSVAVDAEGNVVVVGSTMSEDFSGAMNGYHGGWADTFVAKLSTTGELLWAKYLGGSRKDDGLDIAIGPADEILVTGWTNSVDFSGALNHPHGVGEDGWWWWGDAFVAKLSADGELLWSTYVGGTDDDGGLAISVDAVGNAYITGFTESDDLGEANNSFVGGYYDAFLAKVSPEGALLWTTYFGGSGEESGFGIAVADCGDVFVTGGTLSTDLAGANNEYYGGIADGFVARFSPSGTLLWSTYIGGRGQESGFDIAIDADGYAWVTGGTDSMDFAETENSYWGGDGDAFVAVVAPNGMLLWANYVGGSDEEAAFSIALDTFGSAVIAGATYSSDFEGANNSYKGGGDAFWARIAHAPGNAPPVIAGLSVDPQNFTWYQEITLTAEGVIDSDGEVVGVAFYRDTNNNGRWDNSDELLAIDYHGSDGWSWTGLVQHWGEQTFFARALDNHWAWSDAAAASGELGWPEEVAWFTEGLSSWWGHFKVAVNSESITIAADFQTVFALSTAGEVLWSQEIFSDVDGSIYAIAIDASDNILVTGGQGGNAFVRKLSDDGNLLWSVAVGSDSGAEWGNAISVDAQGSVFVTGESHESGSWEHEADSRWYIAEGVDGLPKDHAFVAKLSAEGSLQWISHVGGSGWDYYGEIAVDPWGNALIAGATTTLNFPMTSGEIPGEESGIVSKFSPEGELLWSSYLGGSLWDFARGIAVDAAGNALVVGRAESSDFVGAINEPTAFDEFGDVLEPFVAKVDPGGTVLWVRYLARDLFPGATYISDGQVRGLASDVVVDDMGSIIATGMAIVLDDAYMGSDAFVAMISPSGSPLWSSCFGRGAMEGMSVALDGAGGALVGGIDYENEWNPFVARILLPEFGISWQNPVNPFDIAANGVVEPYDVLLLINEINRNGAGPLPARTAEHLHLPYYDVNGDGYLTPLDVLMVITHINLASNPPGGEGESATEWGYGSQTPASRTTSLIVDRPEMFRGKSFDQPRRVSGADTLVQPAFDLSHWLDAEREDLDFESILDERMADDDDLDIFFGRLGLQKGATWEALCQQLDVQASVP